MDFRRHFLKDRAGLDIEVLIKKSIFTCKLVAFERNLEECVMFLEITTHCQSPYYVSFPIFHPPFHRVHSSLNWCSVVLLEMLMSSMFTLFWPMHRRCLCRKNVGYKDKQLWSLVISSWEITSFQKSANATVPRPADCRINPRKVRVSTCSFGNCLDHFTSGFWCSFKARSHKTFG